LPTIAGYCLWVRVKLCSSGVSTPWTTLRPFLCTRCARSDKDGFLAPEWVFINVPRYRKYSFAAALDNSMFAIDDGI
jgi:hypothetical protein